MDIYKDNMLLWFIDHGEKGVIQRINNRKDKSSRDSMWKSFIEVRERYEGNYGHRVK